MKVTSSTLTCVLAAALAATLLGGCDRRSPTTDQAGVGGMPSAGTPVSPPSSMMPSPPVMPAVPSAPGAPGAPPAPETGK